MRLRTGLGISLTLAIAVAAAALFVTRAQGASTHSTLSFVIRNEGTEYVTAAGSTSVFPGRLQTGDRIFTRDADMQGARSIGHDNEVCTVTFDDNDLCQAMIVLPGKGQIQATWLWVGRNSSLYGPPHFTGVIDGGTGVYAHAQGQFTGNVLPNGALRFTGALR
jgi:hypothetical protein